MHPWPVVSAEKKITFSRRSIWFIPGLMVAVIATAELTSCATSINASRDALIADITNVAGNAYEYRIRPTTMGGGGGSYIGYTLPRSLSRTQNGTYSVEVTSDAITVRGTSAEGLGDVTAHYGADGRLKGPVQFSGELQ